MMRAALAAELTSAAPAGQPAPPLPPTADRLLHRWLVEYNPVYLFSAALVLAGLNLLSSALVQRGSLYGQLGVAAVAELYAVALIGGAALLTRLGLRRPAVMLALLAVLYQGDLAIHTETCAYLGTIGALAAAAWLVLFVAKLFGLAVALRLRLSATAAAVPTFAAIGAAVLPMTLQGLDGPTKTTMVTTWLFALFAFALWTRRDVESSVGLDAWGRKVLRRALRVSWALWGTLTLGHVLFWATEWRFSIGPLFVAAILLGTRWLRRELAVWLVVGATLALASLAAAGTMWLTAAMAAVVLTLHALRQSVRVTYTGTQDRASGPYRTAGTLPPPDGGEAHCLESFAPAERGARLRLLSGALCSVYLAAWTVGWTGGAWPAHHLLLDVAFAVAIAALVWRTRTRAAVVALPIMCLHWAVQAGHVSMPNTKLQWGLLAVALGFVLLAGSLLASWRWRRLVEPSATPVGPGVTPNGTDTWRHVGGM